MIAKYSLMALLCPKIKQITNQSMGTCKRPILLFFLFLCFVFAAKAQEVEVHSTPAAAAESKISEITPLKVGDKIPDELWDIELPMTSAKSETQKPKLKEYQSKLIILDFWATWCGPCISSLDKLQQLQSKYGEDLMIIPSTYESRDKAIKLLSEKSINLFSVFGEINKQLKAYFPHREIPHQVWIKNNLVYAITNGSQSTPENIASVLADKAVKLTEKRDLKIDHFQSLSTYAKDRNALVYFQSTLTGFIDGATGSGRGQNDNVSVQYFFNRPSIDLYAETLKIPLNRLDLEMKDKISFLNKSFDVRSLYSYQLLSPLNVNEEQLRAMIIQDLNMHFGFYGRFEKKKVKCIILKSSDKPNDGSTLSRSRLNLRMFIDLLNHSFHWDENSPIFLTDIEDDEMFVSDEYISNIDALKFNLQNLKEFTKKHGLVVTEEEREIDVFVISDQISN